MDETRQFDVREDRLTADWEMLSTFRDASAPGWTRRPFTPEYAAARAWLRARMEAAGLRTELDAGANLIGRRPGMRRELPPIVLGSHIDTVAGGGRFDGMVGVLAAVEVARCLDEAGIRLAHDLEVVDFLAEEPTDFGVSTVGSRAIAGALDADMLARRDAQGRTLAEAIASAGGRPNEIAALRREMGAVAAYLELHVEQGPALEAEGLRVGIVTGITGIARYRVELTGRPDHAGTTPMATRRDAFAGAAEVALALEALWQDGKGVGTVGRATVEPNATNVVPGLVELWAEMRSVDGPVLAERRDRFAVMVREMAARRGLGLELGLVSSEEPVPVGARMQALLEESLTELGLPIRRLPSFAGHDGNQLAKVGPIGMLFVPSKDGRSHCPEEWTDLADVALGAQALGAALLHLDARLDAGDGHGLEEAAHASDS